MLRILAIVFLVLAFAGPEIRKNGNTRPSADEQIRAIYIDNSFSMMAEGRNGQLFNEAVNSSRELITQSNRETRFALLDNENSHGRNTMNKEAVTSKLEQLTISPAFKPISAVLQSGLNQLGKKKNKRYEIFLHSDFQKNAFDSELFPIDSIGEYYFIPFAQNRNRNIYIDSCWITTPVLIPGKHAQLMIRLKNAAAEDYEKVPLTVKIDGQQKAVAGVNLKARSTETVKVSFSLGKAGWHTGQIAIEDYPITFDDKLYFSFKIEESLKVLELYAEEKSQTLQMFYKSDSVFQFESMNYRQIDFNRLSTFKLIILNSLPSYSSGLLQQLLTYMEQGGTVFFIPHKRSDFAEQNKFLQHMQAGQIQLLDTASSRVTRIKRKHKLFIESINNIPENAELPTVNQHFRYAYPIRSGLESLVSLLNGDDFLLKKNMGKGELFLLSTPLEAAFSNFSSQALFVPVMYGAAISDEIFDRLFYILKKDEILTADISSTSTGETPFRMQLASSNYSFIPEQQSNNGELRLLLKHDNLKTDGFYELVLNDSVWHVFAFNFDRNESQTDYYSPDEIRQKLRSSGLLNFTVLNSSDNTQTNVINSLQTASRLWMLFVIFALLMLLFEVLLLRFWK